MNLLDKICLIQTPPWQTPRPAPAIKRADKCACCGGELSYTRQKFCSKKCANKYNYRAANGIAANDHEIVKRHCVICGAGITSNKKKKYCTPACSREGKRLTSQSYNKHREGAG